MISKKQERLNIKRLIKKALNELLDEAIQTEPGRARTEYEMYFEALIAGALEVLEDKTSRADAHLEWDGWNTPWGTGSAQEVYQLLDTWEAYIQ